MVPCWVNVVDGVSVKNEIIFRDFVKLSGGKPASTQFVEFDFIPLKVHFMRNVSKQESQKFLKRAVCAVLFQV